MRPILTPLPSEVVAWMMQQGRIELADYCKYLLDETGEYIPPLKKES